MSEFLGMNTEAAQSAVEGFTTAKSSIEQQADTLRSQFMGIRWEGPDAEEFKPRVQTMIDTTVGDLIGTLEEKRTQLESHIEQQNAESNR